MITSSNTRIRPRDVQLVVQRSFLSLKARCGTKHRRNADTELPVHFPVPAVRFVWTQLIQGIMGSNIRVQFDANRPIGSALILIADTETDNSILGRPSNKFHGRQKINFTPEPETVKARHRLN